MAVCWLHRSLLVITRREANCGSQNPYLAVMNTTLGMVFLTAKIMQKVSVKYNIALYVLEWLILMFTMSKNTLL